MPGHSPSSPTGRPRDVPSSLDSGSETEPLSASGPIPAHVEMPPLHPLPAHMKMPTRKPMAADEITPPAPPPVSAHTLRPEMDEGPEDEAGDTGYDDKLLTNFEAQQYQEAISAARDALNTAERNARTLQAQLEAGSAQAAINATRLSAVMKELGEWRLWESLLRNPVLAHNVAAWQAAREFAQIIKVMPPGAVNSVSIGPLLAAITSLREQVDFVDKQRRSVGWLEIAEIYRGAAHRIRWKVAVALAATTADVGASGGDLKLKILLAALAGAGAASATTAVLDEIRDRTSAKSMERTPEGRLHKAQVELLEPIDVLTELLFRRAGNDPPEKGEAEVMRTVELVAEFRAINVRQCAAESTWAKHRQYSHYIKVLKQIRNLLDDVIVMATSQDYREAERISEELDEAVEDLKQNEPKQPGST
jgi:hypothetical protein